jgi:thiol-disulfide isomerase/thioredoxin
LLVLALLPTSSLRAEDAPPQLTVAMLRQAPDFSVVDRGGATVPRAALGGKATLLDFWATWCQPCIKLMPELDQIHAVLGPRGLVIAGINEDTGPGAQEKATRFFDERALRYPLYFDTLQPPAWQQLGFRTLPRLYLLDGEGRIRAEWGAKVTRAEIEAKVLELLGPAPAVP